MCAFSKPDRSQNARQNPCAAGISGFLTARTVAGPAGSGQVLQVLPWAGAAVREAPRPPAEGGLGLLPAQRESKPNDIAVGPARVTREQRGPQLLLEWAGVRSQDVLGADRGRVEESGDRLDRPVVRLEMAMAGDVLESRLPKHPFRMLGAAARHRPPLSGAGRRIAARPSSDDARHGALPRLLSAQESVAAPEDGQAAARPKPIKRPPGHKLLVEPVEGVPNGYQLERGRWRLQFLGLPDRPSDIAHAPPRRLIPPCLDHLGLKVDRP